MGNPHSQLTTNQKIVAWVDGQLGKKIGRGECWDLGEEALKNAAAQTSNDLGPVGKDTDYVWGDPINDLKDVQPGDILQIRGHLVTTTTVTKYVFEDGAYVTDPKIRIARRGHHTAIVKTKPDVNGVLKTYEQHVNGRDVIQNMTLYTRTIPEQTSTSNGRFKHPGTKKLEKARITTTVTVEVEGAIWAYRPKPK